MLLAQLFENEIKEGRRLPSFAKLYHVSPRKNLESIRRHGLDPKFSRGTKAIYLASDPSHAGGYDDHHGQNGESIMLTIDVKMLDPVLLFPDDADFPDMLDDPDGDEGGKPWWEYTWQESLFFSGQCRYEGKIPPAAIEHGLSEACIMVEKRSTSTATSREQEFSVPVKLLSKYFNPFAHAPWGGVDRITKEEVADAVRQNKLSSDVHDEVYTTYERHLPKTYHVNRIAYLVVHPDSTPLIVAHNRFGSYYLEDGYHRIAAAIFRGDKAINIMFPDSIKKLDNWLLFNKSRFTESTLPMDTASRMKRAQELGFTVRAYHGTGQKFNEFDLEKGKYNPISGYAPHFSVSRAEAQGYADQANAKPDSNGEALVLDCLLRVRKPFIASHKDRVTRNEFKRVVGTEPDVTRNWDTSFDMLRTILHNTAHEHGWDDRRKIWTLVYKRLMDLGYDAIYFPDTPADFTRPDYTKIVVFDPKNIRSVRAKFDPAQSESRNLLA